MSTELQRSRMESEPNLERRDYRQDFVSVVADYSELILTPPYVTDIMHYHNCLELGICLQGSGTVTVGDQSWTYTPGTVLLMPRNVRHAQQNENGSLIHWRYLAVNEERLLLVAAPECRTLIERMLQQVGSSCLVLQKTDFEAEISFYFDLLFDWHQKRGEAARPETEACVVLLLTRIAHHAEQSVMGLPVDTDLRRPVEPAITYVAEHYAQSVTVAQMARSCAMSESYFRNVFRRLMHMSPLEYLNRYRIHRAMNLLRVTDYAITNVALRCGFPSVATFNRNFQHYVQETPTSWRRRRGLQNRFDA